MMCAWTVAPSRSKPLFFRLVVLVCVACFGQSLTMVSLRADPSRVLNSIVSVLPEWKNPQLRAKEPEGSGIVILDGQKILTARHVIKDALSVRVRTRDGRIIAAHIVGDDRLTDLAILAIDEKLVPLDFGRSARLGERVCALGNAFGLGLSMTCGVVSAIHKTGVGFNPIEDFVQTDAAFNPGASGGALIAEDGSFVGVLSAIFTKETDANIGVNFAVSAHLAKRVALALVRNQRVHWVFSGLKLKKAVARNGVGTLGAVVVNVGNNTPGHNAGLEIGDVILMLGKRRIKKPADFRSAFVSMPPGSKHEMTIMRQKSKISLAIEMPE